MIQRMELTRYMCACSELSSHDRVHGDHYLLLLRHQGVSVLDLPVDPLLKIGTDDGCAHINDPPLGHLLKVRVIWQILVDPWLLTGEAHYVFECEVLVLGNVQRFHFVCGDVCLLPSQDVLQEVDRDVI